MVPVNWLFEAIKWQSLLKPYTSINIITSFKGVLIGLASRNFYSKPCGRIFWKVFGFKSQFIFEGSFGYHFRKYCSDFGYNYFGCNGLRTNNYLYFPEMAENSKLNLTSVLSLTTCFLLSYGFYVFQFAKIWKSYFALSIF
jgi:hypothetical protein